ncbi:MAG: dephospho-CoA kinase, partial [Akkermansiaceae bacterium]|nr:dephospho-CoA kinase [Akkermansiaceae bacterium]
MNESQTPPKNIVLIGFMGSGKSTVGRELHQRLGYPLVDMDQVIEMRTRKSIRTI